MIVNYDYAKERGRLTLHTRPESFDGDPGIEGIFLDGINETLSRDAVGLAAWMFLGRFASWRLALPEPISLPLADRIKRQWGGSLALQPVDDKPARFPQRVGSLLIAAGESADQSDLDPAAFDGPIYHFHLLPAGGSGTLYEGGRVLAKTNIGLIGQGVNGPGIGGTLAAAMLYADFLGISNLVLPGAAIDCGPPTKAPARQAPPEAWRELIKHAGFNLRVVG
jgi:hypothetical protein